MPLTELQREVCRIIAANRRESGESYVAGAAALNELLAGPRLSRDIDLFHDTEEALQATWERDRELLQSRGFSVEVVRERRTFVEARVSRAGEAVNLEWAHDSAFRFFPLVEHPIFGLTLHPFDLATNKTLAMVGRLEVRDWVDLMTCAERLQPLGYLAWAACGKDPGFNPELLLDYAARCRYSALEVSELSFSGPPPDAALLSQQWRTMLEEARRIVRTLPAETAGQCVLDSGGQLFRGDLDALRGALTAESLQYHAGSLRGALPRLVPETPDTA